MQPCSALNEAGGTEGWGKRVRCWGAQARPLVETKQKARVSNARQGYSDATMGEATARAEQRGQAAAAAAGECSRSGAASDVVWSHRRGWAPRLGVGKAAPGAEAPRAQRRGWAGLGLSGARPQASRMVSICPLPRLLCSCTEAMLADDTLLSNALSTP